MSALQHGFGQVSGTSLRSFSAIGIRSIEAAKIDWRTGESHVYAVDGDRAHVELPTPGVFASIWRSMQGDLHIAHRDGALFWKQSDGDYSRCDVRASLLGVWGLDTDHVYAWGLSGATPVMFRYASQGRWLPMPAPPELVFAMSGDRSDRLVAVGMYGSISFWDGSSWSARLSPVTGALASVHWVGEDEIWACGTGTPFVLEGSIHGWVRHGPFEQSMYCIAKHGDSVWVGCGLGGLRRFVPRRTELELVKPTIEAQHFDARGDLLISTPEQIVGTSDGEAFAGVRVEGYRDLAGLEPPTFTP